MSKVVRSNEPYAATAPAFASAAVCEIGRVACFRRTIMEGAMEEVREP
jgi:hypothetical protein